MPPEPGARHERRARPNSRAGHRRRSPRVDRHSALRGGGRPRLAAHAADRVRGPWRLRRCALGTARRGSAGRPHAPGAAGGDRRRRGARRAQARSAPAAGAARARRRDRAGDVRARADGRRPAGAPFAPEPLERVGGRARPRTCRDAGGRLALRRPRHLDPAERPARSSGAPHARGTARLLARAPLGGRAAHRRARDAADPVRHPGGRERPGRARAARPRAAAPGRGLAVAPAHATPRGGDRRCRGGERGGAVAPGGLRARRRARVVGPRGMEPLRQGRGDHVRLEPRVRPTRLVAGRGDRAQREVRQTPLLEGRGTRFLRRVALGALRGGGRQPLRPRGPVLGVESRRPLGLQRVQPELGRAHPLHGPLAVQHDGRRRGRHPPSGRRGRRPAELRRNHPAADEA